jgi:hypothetical protein
VPGVYRWQLTEPGGRVGTELGVGVGVGVGVVPDFTAVTCTTRFALPEEKKTPLEEIPF